jgi:hypothetical protein
LLQILDFIFYILDPLDLKDYENFNCLYFLQGILTERDGSILLSSSLRQLVFSPKCDKKYSDMKTSLCMEDNCTDPTHTVCSMHIEIANKHCQYIACTRSFNMGLTSAEGQSLK